MKKLFILLFAIIMLFCGCESNIIEEDSTDTDKLFTPAQTQPKIEKILNSTSECTFVLLEDGSVWYWGVVYKPGNEMSKTIYETGTAPVGETKPLIEKEATYKDVTLIELPQKLEFEGIDLKNNVKDIVVLGLSTFVLLKNGDLYSFGANTVAGILGDGTTYDRFTPKKILSNVSEILYNTSSAATKYTEEHFPEYDKQQTYTNPIELHKYFRGYAMYALKDNGELYSWGYNFIGQLYNGKSEDSALPIKIQDNIKTIYGNKGILVAEKLDGTVLLSFQSDNELDATLTLQPSIKLQGEALDIYDVWIEGKNTIGVLYKNGELWHYNRKGQGSIFEKDVKEYNGSEFLKVDGTLYKYKTVDEGVKADSNVKTIKGGMVIYNDNSIYTSDLNGNKYRIEKVLSATNQYHISADTGYLYARGGCADRSLGIELNPDEEFIEMPVQVLFPAGWNK